MLNTGFFPSNTNTQSTTGCQLINWLVILINSNASSCDRVNYFKMTEYLWNNINYLLYNFCLCLLPRRKQKGKLLILSDFFRLLDSLWLQIFRNVFRDISIRQRSWACQNWTASLQLSLLPFYFTNTRRGRREYMKLAWRNSVIGPKSATLNNCFN